MVVRVEDHPGITDLMTRLIRCCHKMEESLTSTIGLKMAEIRCLKIFEEDTLTVGDIARRMELSASRLSRILDGLYQEGHVQRVEDQADRRRSLISLSTSGEKLRKQILEEFSELDQMIMDSLGKDQEVIIQSLEKLVEAVEGGLGR